LAKKITAYGQNCTGGATVFPSVHRGWTEYGGSASSEGFVKAFAPLAVLPGAGLA